MPKRGEIITINVGGAGLRIGHEVWNQLMPEHNISYNGRPSGKAESTPFFEETRSGHFIPRNIFADTEPTVNDTIRNGPLADAFDPQFILNGKEDTGGNWANGHFGIGKEIMYQVNDRVRKQVEQSDSPQGFILNHSLGGGTGSGLGTLILERLAVDYRKKAKIACSVLGGDVYGRKMPFECYNELLATQKMLDLAEAALVFDNAAFGKTCQDADKTPSYEHVNKLIAKTVSGITGPLRFDVDGWEVLNEFQTDLVPFPRLHFLLTSLAPTSADAKQSRSSVKDLVSQAVNSNRFNVKIADFDPIEDKYMAIKLFGRGGITSKEMNTTVQWIHRNNKVQFVEWCPTGFKIVNCPKPMAKTEGENFGTSGKSVLLLGNNVAINRKFSANNSKYDKMYSGRAYVHHYVYHGMEEGEFSEAREDMGFLEKDYLDVVAEHGDHGEKQNDDFAEDDDWF